MRATDRIARQDWMVRPSTTVVLAALTAAGGPARFVGGCVRDSVLGRAVKDIDIATPTPPATVMALLVDAGIKVVPTGLAHGTVTAVVERDQFEITTLRRDVETYGRHAKVAFTDDWAADAARRDFTMNALYLDTDGGIYDPTGGLADVRQGRVRFVGDPAGRIGEDYLRILRFFRFYAHYGRGEVDRAGLAACRALASGLRRLSGERVRDELLRLLAAPEPTAVLRLMADGKILDQVLPEATRIDRLAGLLGVDRAVDPLRRLAALVAGEPESLTAAAARLRFSNRQRDRLVAAAGPFAATDPAAGCRLLYRIGAEAYRDRLLLAWAEAPSQGRYERLLAKADNWRRPKFPLGGKDVIALGIERGARVGDLLDAVEDWWVEGDFQAGRADCLARLEASV